MPGLQTQELGEGWMGRYGRREEGLRILLSSQEGWASFARMELPDAVELFRSGRTDADRTGAARSYLELASLHEALEGFLLELEAQYVEALGPLATAQDRDRRGLANLLQGDIQGARAAFSGERPEKTSGVGWALGVAGIAVAEGRRAEAESLLRQAYGAARRAEERTLVQVACASWSLPLPGPGVGSLAKASHAVEKRDFAGALRLLEEAGDSARAGRLGAGLFVHRLYRRVYGALALDCLSAPGAPGSAFWSAQAKEHLGDAAGAALLYAQVGDSAGTDAAPAWMYSPVTGSAEGMRLAQVLDGAARCRSAQPAAGVQLWRRVAKSGGAGPLVTAVLALEQTRVGGREPYEDPSATAAAALSEVRASLEALAPRDKEDLLPSVYPVRVSAVSRAAAEVFRRKGDRRSALDAMERAHRKAGGFQPDFVNTPAFLVDLSRAYAGSGEYASAVAVLFELSHRYAVAGPAYESLKRLYATKTGGGAAPKY